MLMIGFIESYVNASAVLFLLLTLSLHETTIVLLPSAKVCVMPQSVPEPFIVRFAAPFKEDKQVDAVSLTVTFVATGYVVPL